MTSDTDDTDEGSGGKTGKGGSAGGGMKMTSRTPPPMSPDFFEKMKQFGATGEQLAKIITDWAYYTAEQISDRLKEFIEGIYRFSDPVSRASAQMLVDFGNKGYGMLVHFLADLKEEKIRELMRSRERGRTRTRSTKAPKTPKASGPSFGPQGSSI